MVVKIKVQCNNLTCEVCDTEDLVCDNMLGQEGGGAQLSGLFLVTFSF